MSVIDQNTPLVSVIIPCYNQAIFLSEAIESVLDQSYPSIEIIVVNDGSTDHTEEVVKRWPIIKYIRQSNQGLSAARNTGIDHAQGEFLAFLDADDYLHRDAIRINVRYLLENSSAAFVSGGHNKVDANKNILVEERSRVNKDHYMNLLQGNYIGMHGAVLYRKNIFSEFKFDQTLNACEDYDLYLKITRKHGVIHHDKLIADYRIHHKSMSANIPKMLNAVLLVLDRQKAVVQNEREKNALNRGRAIWQDYYKNLAKKPYGRFTTQNITGKGNNIIKRMIKRISPGSFLRLAHKMGIYKNYKPAIGQVSLGDLNSTTPFSFEFGYDRGGPVDRYYIEEFLSDHFKDIKGRVLEIGDNTYTQKFGGDKVQQSQVLHIDENNSQADFIADLSNAPHLPEDAFDCIILTQTLHLIYDFHAAVNTCYRILKKGGVLLLTSPGITNVDHGEWNNSWYWSFNSNSLRKILLKSFPIENLEVHSYGNVHAATAFLYGMGLSEVSKKKLDHRDPHYEVIITARAIK